MVELKPLPQKQLLWIQSSDIKVEEISMFLHRILLCNDLICDRFLQMFLQSQLSLEFIEDMVEGKKVSKAQEAAEDLKDAASEKPVKEDKNCSVTERKRKSYVEHVSFCKDKPVHLLLEELKHSSNM